MLLVKQSCSFRQVLNEPHGFQGKLVSPSVFQRSPPVLVTPKRHNLHPNKATRSNHPIIGGNMKMAATEGVSNAETILPSLEELKLVEKVAIQASKAAGEIIIGNAGGAEVTERKANSRDLLTLIDPMCEKLIQETVFATFPDHDFLGEEMVAPGKEASAAALGEKIGTNAKSDWLWIVDPIDGTTNFVHGMPLCMPSVAVAYKGEIVVGVIYDPHRDELFTAIKGHGSYLNEKEKIFVGKQDTIGDAIVAMGSPPGAESLEMSLKGVKVLMPKVRTIRMLGSAAIMLAWVACGRLTAYWEYDLSSWDIAAGAILVEEAGGKFTDLQNTPFSLQNRKMIASNGLVHEAILEELNAAGVK
jgi:myo-inositol-1(or 4)-monophosphatase